MSICQDETTNSRAIINITGKPKCCYRGNFSNEKLATKSSVLKAGF